MCVSVLWHMLLAMIKTVVQMSPTRNGMKSELLRSQRQHAGILAPPRMPLRPALAPVPASRVLQSRLVPRPPRWLVLPLARDSSAAGARARAAREGARGAGARRALRAFDAMATSRRRAYRRRVHAASSRFSPHVPNPSSCVPSRVALRGPCPYPSPAGAAAIMGLCALAALSCGAPAVVESFGACVTGVHRVTKVTF